MLLPIGCGSDSGGGNADWSPYPPKDVSAKTSIYVTLVSHNESDGRYDAYDLPEGYAQFRSNLLAISNIVDKYDAKWNMQTDWRFLRAIERFESPELMRSTGGMNILQYLSSRGVEIDPHSHETEAYNLADIACIVNSLGVAYSNTVGGFLLDEDWTRYREPLTGNVEDGCSWKAEILWGGASLEHAGQDEKASGVWKPESPDNFYTNDPDADLVYVGLGGDLYGLEALTDQLKNGELPPGMIYTVSITIFEFEFLQASSESADMLEYELGEVNEYRDEGLVKWANISEVAEIYRKDYNETPNIYFTMNAL